MLLLETLNVIILFSSALLLFFLRRRHRLKWQEFSSPQKWLVVLLIAASLTGYFQLGGMPQRNNGAPVSFHLHDIYHYYLGPKYYRELGHTRLYKCTYLAFNEISDQGFNTPEIKYTRSLKNIWQRVEIQELNTGSCRDHFSAQRWDGFKTDLKVFLHYQWSDDEWQKILTDHGNNQPPSWNILVGTIVNALPFSPVVLQLLPLLDVTILFVLIPLIIRKLGLLPLLTYFIVLMNNPLADYGWTGGSLFRSTWFLMLAAGIMSLAGKKVFTAGIFFGVATAFKLFPALFALGALLPMVYRREKSSIAAFISGAGISLLALFFWSLLVYGLNHWMDFYENILKHSKMPAMNHIGFYNYSVYTDGLKQLPELGMLQILGPTEIQFFRSVYEQGYLQNQLILVLATAAAAIIGTRQKTYISALIFGSVSLYFLSIPAGYYYLYLALMVPFLFLKQQSIFGRYRMLVTWAILIIIPLQAILLKSLILECASVNTVFYYYFLILVLLFLLEETVKSPDSHKPG